MYVIYLIPHICIIVFINTRNPLKPEFSIVIFIHYKLRIVVIAVGGKWKKYIVATEIVAWKCLL